MIRRLWHFLFGGCLHEYRWEPHEYADCETQRGTCSKCGYIKEKVITWTKQPDEDQTPTWRTTWPPPR